MFRLFKSHRRFKGINSVLPGCCVKKNVAKPVRDCIQNKIKLGGYSVRIRTVTITCMAVSSAYICNSPSQDSFVNHLSVKLISSIKTIIIYSH